VAGAVSTVGREMQIEEVRMQTELARSLGWRGQSIWYAKANELTAFVRQPTPLPQMMSPSDFPALRSAYQPIPVHSAF
jgi:hypothetical protein